MPRANMMPDSPDDLSDTSLLLAGADGDRAAFATLFDRHSRAVFATAIAVVRDRPDAEEVLSDAFMLLWRKRHEIEFFGDSLLPWLLVTARNLARNRVRSMRGNLSYDDDISLVDTLTTEDHVARRQLDRLLSSVIGALDPIDREIIQLCLVDKLSYQQAAQRLGLTHSSVRNRLSRSKSQLRSQLSTKETDQ